MTNNKYTGSYEAAVDMLGVLMSEFLIENRVSHGEELASWRALFGLSQVTGHEVVEVVRQVLHAPTVWVHVKKMMDEYGLELEAVESLAIYIMRKQYGDETGEAAPF